MTTTIMNQVEKNVPLAAALNLVGDRWTLMILSSALSEIARFNDFEKTLGINRSLLSSRLAKLVDSGLMEKRKYQEKPARFEYHITDAGKDIRPVLTSLSNWSEKHFSNEQTSTNVTHSEVNMPADMHV